MNITANITGFKTIQDRSREFRWLEVETGKTLMNEHGFYYKETKLVLQVACPYQSGSNGGFEWRDIPVVKLSGEEK